MELKAGAANVVITPPVGVEVAGYSFGPSLGVLDELEAQALVLRGDGLSVAIIAVDILTVSPGLVNSIRQHVYEELGIPRDAVVVSASHSHSSATAYPLRQWGRVDARYIQWLEQTLIGLVRQAWQSARDAKLGIGLGRVDNLSDNRRGLRDLRDISVPVLRIDDLDGVPIAVLFNFACHPVSLHSYRNLFSPDYPGYARQVLRKVLGQDVTAMFTLGAAGDINPARYIHGGTTPVRARQIGEILGCEVAKVALEPSLQLDILRINRIDVELPVVALPSEQELKTMQANFAAEAARYRAEGQPWEYTSRSEIAHDWALDALQVVQQGQAQKTVQCEIQAVRLGEAVLLAAPLELFTQTGLDIKRASAAKVTMICSNSNGGLGYLPTRDAYDGDDYTNPQGLAPKVYGIYAFAMEAEPHFRNEAIRLINRLFT